MTRLTFRSTAHLMFATAFGIASIICATAQDQKDNGDQKKDFDVRSNVGDLHVGNDADARKAGLPLYPGARLHHDAENSDALNFGVLAKAFGVKLVVVKYDSDDAPVKVIDFYRDRLKKYGKVIECHTHEHGGDAHADIDSDDEHPSKEVKCNGDNSGPVTELKVGREDNQHVVAVEPNDGGKSSTFALVYLYSRGKQGDI